MPLIAIMGLATVLQRSIYTVYPEVNHVFRQLLHYRANKYNVFMTVMQRKFMFCGLTQHQTARSISLIQATFYLFFILIMIFLWTILFIEFIIFLCTILGLFLF